MGPLILCLPSHPVFAKHSSAFGDKGEQFGYPVLETAMTEFTNIFFLCFIQVEVYCTADLFLSAFLRPSAEDGRVGESKGVPAPLPCKMRAHLLKRGLLRTKSDCAAESVAATFAFAPAGKIVWTVPDCLG